MVSSNFFLAAAVTALSSVVTAGTPPTASLKNGTYQGLYLDSLNQDLFLGIPYAQPPVGDLRLRNPVSLNQTFGTKQAVAYGPSCIGYGNSPAWPFTLSEDCLTLNVVRPAGVKPGGNLPVAVWIHGGGYVMDYAANAVYNLSWIVQESVRMQKPIIAVSFDYRLSAWGFLGGDEVVKAGIANIGLKDQYIALRFINENIAAFGGDPTKAVIWGESAGGGSVGYQAQAYGGRNDGLFRGIIAESAAEGNNPGNMSVPNALFKNITESTGCGAAADKLQCLRQLPVETLNNTVKVLSGFAPIVDGDFVPDLSSTLLSQGKFIKVPLLIGSNTDEGTLFTGPGINTDAQFTSIITGYGADANTTTILSILYPDIPSIGIPETINFRPNATYGLQYKRAASLIGDFLILAPRRLRNLAWWKQGVPTYAYQFDAPSANPYFGTTHFQEIGYVFHNVKGQGYAAGVSPFENATERTYWLAKFTCRAWISFIHDLDPNNHGLPHVEKWQPYNNTDSYATKFYINSKKPVNILDTNRLEGTTFINGILEEQFDR